MGSDLVLKWVILAAAVLRMNRRGVQGGSRSTCEGAVRGDKGSGR